MERAIMVGRETGRESAESVGIGDKELRSWKERRG